MTCACITLSSAGARLGERLAALLPEMSLYVHESVEAPPPGAVSFASTMELTAQLFPKRSGLIYVMPAGVAVRAIAPLLQNKFQDPAVVVLDVCGRHAVSLLSGHEGGANALALAVANAIAAEPVITTSSEAGKNLVVGVGCRQGASSEHITRAIEAALGEIGRDIHEVRWLASADIKRNEPGLNRAAQDLGLPLRFIASSEIRKTLRDVAPNPFVLENVKLPAVAEPAALLAGRRTQLLLPRQVFHQVTVAVAEESCTW